jgi:hypothetical protein
MQAAASTQPRTTSDTLTPSPSMPLMVLCGRCCCRSSGACTSGEGASDVRKPSGGPESPRAWAGGAGRPRYWYALIAVCSLHSCLHWCAGTVCDCVCACVCAHVCVGGWGGGRWGREGCDGASGVTVGVSVCERPTPHPHSDRVAGILMELKHPLYKRVRFSYLKGSESGQGQGLGSLGGGSGAGRGPASAATDPMDPFR